MGISKQQAWKDRAAIVNQLLVLGAVVVGGLMEQCQY